MLDSYSYLNMSKKQQNHSIEPSPSPPLRLILLPLPLLLAINNPQRILALRRRRQVLIPLRRDQDIIFNPYAAHGVVLLQQILVDELCVARLFEEESECVAGEVAIGNGFISWGD